MKVLVALGGLALVVALVVSAARSSGAGADVGGILLDLLAFLILSSGVIAGIAALAQRANRSVDVRYTGTVRHEHSGTVRYEHTGSVQHTHRHVHEIAKEDRARLDQMAADRELENALADLRRVHSTEWSTPVENLRVVPIEQSARRELTAGPDGVYR